MAGKKDDGMGRNTAPPTGRERHFPDIAVSPSAGGFEAVAGFRLTSLLKRELLEEAPATQKPQDHGAAPAVTKRLLDSREGFVHALSSLPHHLSVELHHTVLPDLVDRTGGEIQISLFLRAILREISEAREAVVSGYLMIRPLIDAYMPEAGFQPITDTKELSRRRHPFHRTHATAICRQKEMIALSEPLRRRTPGFGPAAMGKMERRDDVVRYTFPSVPSQDDWSRLLDTLSGQMDPVQIIVRIRAEPASEETCPGTRWPGSGSGTSTHRRSEIA